LDDYVGEHFGRVPTYTIVNSDTNEVKTVPNISHHMGGQVDPPEIMLKEGVDVLVCSGLGRRAISAFDGYGIAVYIGASGKVREAVNAFKQGKLQKASASDACGKHSFRDRHHF
jgi:predicted Fe-Mo cluster-binding NifX family protein